VSGGAPAYVHEVSVVIPVYRGARTLRPLVAELSELAVPAATPRGRLVRVAEVLLVDDRGPDGSAETIRQLEAEHPEVRAVWLSRNFGQHAATLAGMASSTGSWIVTLDEDGQHDPAAIGRMLDVALDEQRSLVYAKPTNRPPHSPFRNASSQLVKWLATRVLAPGDLGEFHSFRLVLGEVGRSVAAYCGRGVYLDVALSWVVDRPGTCPVAMRDEGAHTSGYDLRRLVGHFLRLVLTAGTRPLRFISVLGILLSLLGMAAAAYVAWGSVVRGVDVEGWTSVIIAVLVLSGAILFSLGVISEYLGIAVGMAMGRPPYLIVSDPERGPLAQRAPVAAVPAEPVRDAR